jgi:hypothetical protein
MAKNIFDIVTKIEQSYVDSNLTNIVFIGVDSYAELLYKKTPCEVIQQAHRYMLVPKNTIKQDADFYSVFENALLTQKKLKSSPESKLIFVINASDISNARGKEFTNWLKAIDLISFGSHNILSSSCLVIEQVSTDSNPIIELESFVQDSCGRISETNLRLLGEWLNNRKVLLINNFTKKDLGEYNGEEFRAELDMVLTRCKPISYLDSKPFLPSDTIDWQLGIYKQKSQDISDKCNQFMQILKQSLVTYLDESSQKNNLNGFKKNYYEVLDKLNLKEMKLSEAIIFLTKQINNLKINNVAKEIISLEEQQAKIIKLMPYLEDLHDQDKSSLEFKILISDTKEQISNIWSKSIIKTDEAEKEYLVLYDLVEQDEKFKGSIKSLGMKLCLKKQEKNVIQKQIDDLTEKYKELHKVFNKIELCCKQQNNNLYQVLLYTLEGHSHLTEIHKVIYQAIQFDIKQTNQSSTHNFVYLYADHIRTLYSELYSNHKDAITKLEGEYEKWHKVRESVVVGGTLGVGAVVGATIGVAVESIVLGAIIGVPLPLITITTAAVSGGVGYAKRNEISKNFELFKLGFKEVEFYYKQLPKELREKWAEINTFPKLSQYLKGKYAENKIYSSEEKLENTPLLDNTGYNNIVNTVNEDRHNNDDSDYGFIDLLGTANSSISTNY